MSKIDSSLLDKAILFATKAHKDVERRGKGFPYIAHPLEAMSIVATMTNDQELLAAACLHDVIEDTDYTYEDIKKEFGERIADLVQAESDVVIPNKNAADSWIERKQIAMDHLASSSREVQMVALGDKLSNMRALARDYQVIGEELWNRFHVTDPKLHAWHYRGLIKSLNKVQDTFAFQEFVFLIERTFAARYDDFSYRIEGEDVILSGDINKEAVLSFKDELNPSKLYYFDFNDVYNINFSGIRALITLQEEGYRFLIRRATKRVASRFASVGSSISVLRNPHPYDATDLEQSGDGYTGVTYWTSNGDAMVKLYYNFVDIKEIEKEKRYATEALKLGIPTPLSGDLITIDGKVGILFERINGKVSFARAMANDPTRIEELAKDFALLARKLHSTPCDKNVFMDVKEKYIPYVNEMKGLSEDEKAIVKGFIYSRRDTGTCLHGDFHFGNVILTNDNEKLFIDMGDFSYGDPLFDVGTLYLTCHMENEEMVQKLYHTSCINVYKFYQYFIKYYFDNMSEKEADILIKPYACMTALLFAHKGGEKEWMSSIIRRWLINRG